MYAAWNTSLLSGSRTHHFSPLVVHSCSLRHGGANDAGPSTGARWLRKGRTTVSPSRHSACVLRLWAVASLLGMHTCLASPDRTRLKPKLVGRLRVPCCMAPSDQTNPNKPLHITTSLSPSSSAAPGPWNGKGKRGDDPLLIAPPPDGKFCWTLARLLARARLLRPSQAPFRSVRTIHKEPFSQESDKQSTWVPSVCLIAGVQVGHVLGGGACQRRRLASLDWPCRARAVGERQQRLASTPHRSLPCYPTTLGRKGIAGYGSSCNEAELVSDQSSK